MCCLPSPFLSEDILERFSAFATLACQQAFGGDGKAKRPVDKHLGPPFHGTCCASDPDASSYWREHRMLTGLIDIGFSVGT